MRIVGFAIFVSLSLAACASTGWPTGTNASAITDTPDHFLVVDTATGTTAEPSGTACRNPMTDPRDGTRLILMRSNSGFGDYQTDARRYGLADGELLRIDCSNGRPVGATAAAR